MRVVPDYSDAPNLRPAVGVSTVNSPILSSLLTCPELGSAVHHPQLRNNFGNQLTVAEQSHNGALGNNHGDRFCRGAHVGGGNMTAAQSQRQLNLRSHRIEVSAS